MQQLVQEGVPQEMAMEIIQMVIEQLQGGAQQQAPPQEAMQQQSPMQMYGGSYKHGGYYGNVPQHGNPGVYGDGYSGTSSGGQYFAYGGQPRVGEEMDVTPGQLEELRRQGIQFKIIK